MSYIGTTEERFRAIIPFNEIQRHEGNCWATSLSIQLRLYGFDRFTQSYVTSLYPDWRYDGITIEQLDALAQFFQREIDRIYPQEWRLSIAGSWQGGNLLNYIGENDSYTVFIKGHFVVLLGYDDEKDEVLYYDPWDGQVRQLSKGIFATLGRGETVLLFKN